MLSLFAVITFAAALTLKYRAGRSGSKLSLILGGVGMAVVILGLVIYLGGDESLTRGLGLAATPGNDVSNGRLHFWSIAIKIFLDHPVIGAGFEAFGVAFTRYETWNGVLRVEQAHNDYLQMLADGGVLAFACVVGFGVMLFRKGLATVQKSGAGIRRDAAIGALSGCVGIMVHSFFDFPLRTWSNSFFFLLIVAVAIAAIRSDVPHKGKRRRRSTEH